MEIKEITIIGAGLIGGSIAKSLSRYDRFNVTCVDSDINSLQCAMKEGTDFKVTEDILGGVENADLVFICTPVMEVPGIIRNIVHSLKKGTIVTDVGSTKSWLIDEIRGYINDDIYFIGGHPMAGSEKIGFSSSCHNLFDKASYILTPLENTPDYILEEMKKIICLMGASTHVIDMKYHDSLAAAASHLPYVLSVCLMTTINSKADDNIYKISAGGLRDMTRISESSTRMWRDICLTNKEELKSIIYNFTEQLDSFLKILDDGEGSIIEEYFVKARESKHKLTAVKELVTQEILNKASERK